MRLCYIVNNIVIINELSYCFCGHERQLSQFMGDREQRREMIELFMNIKICLRQHNFLVFWFKFLKIIYGILMNSHARCFDAKQCMLIP